MKVSGPLVSVVIVNWNGLDDTKKCLRYLKEQTYKNLEIIVVDNGSRDGSLSYLEGLKDIVLIENHKNLGFTGGHIAGYKASSGQYILLLNNDAVMNPDYISLAVATMDSDLKIGAIGGRAYLWDEANPLFDTSNRYYAYQNINPITAEGIFEQQDFGNLQEVNNVSGSCVLVRRSVTEKIGYLHEPFFAYFEESDLFARMKRAGYKVMYQPDLAIWHASAKTSNKKSPTFSLYMMMRNRFRFAVRNFDSWTLRRFLKFYLIMGCASIIRSITDSSQRGMHRAYTKAFFYNIAFGLVPFYERWRLSKSLKSINYSQQIIQEQSPLSVIVRVESESALKKCMALAANLDGNNEIMAVTSRAELAQKAKAARVQHLRVCIDRGYFNTHPENLAAITARNEWLILAAGTGGLTADVVSHFHSVVYALKKSNKFMAVMGETRQITETKEIFTASLGSVFLIDRSEFIDAGGLLKDLPRVTAWRCLLLYGLLNSSIIQLPGRQFEQLPAASSPNISELTNLLLGKINESSSLHRKETPWSRLINRYYRLAQLSGLIKWLASPGIGIRLKLGRSKNLIFAAANLNRPALAIELKHMKNEIAKNRYFVDIVKMKKHENIRLNYLINHPDETVVFLIVRDRLELMRDLIRWLEHQDISKIVFVDNDSRLPSLVSFLDNTKYQVLAMGRNTLQTGVWSAGIARILVPDDFYIVSDPDVLPTRVEKDVIKHLYEIHGRYPHHLKVGLGLKIDDLPDRYPLKDDVIKWESQFWKYELEPGIYEAGVDTTFALYKPYVYSYILHPSLRTGNPYTARHLPWYNGADDLSDEEIFYRLRLDQNVNTWNKEQLPERYRKELTRQGH